APRRFPWRPGLNDSLSLKGAGVYPKPGPAVKGIRTRGAAKASPGRTHAGRISGLGALSRGKAASYLHTLGSAVRYPQSITVAIMRRRTQGHLATAASIPSRAG